MRTKKVQLRFKPGFENVVSWGKPDSPRRSLCAVCHGPLEEVPLMAWRDDGGMISLCETCTEKWIERVE